MRPLLSLSLCLISLNLFAAGKELEGERAAATTVCPTPEEARAKMSVPEGYEVRCFAHEPMVQNPVAMTWDHRGRLWVVEAYEYPEGTPLPVDQRPFGGEAKDDQYHPMPKLGAKIPRDRVIILEDTDNDGTADKRTVFVEGLNLASAIICGDSGIYVGQQPHLIHFRDDDGDDKPDAWRVVLTGFGREDTHELVNSFTWGPDGWLYMTHGVFTNSKVRRPGQPEKEGFKFDAGIGRARPSSAGNPARSPASGAGTPARNSGSDVGTPARKESSANTPVPSWEFEVFADGTSNPWGCDYDAAGNFFVSACVIDHFFHMAPGGIYTRQGGAPENPYAYELLPSIVKHKHFRAAYAGIQIYQGGRYPADTHGHAFIGNIHDNAIHEEVLTPVGATFKCEPRRDFLRANNGWFRPVSTQTGPDGFLWIMDWCDKYPCYQNAKANPEGVDRERGRIWRVVTTPEDSRAPAKTSHASRPAIDLNFKKLATPELVKTLEDSNNWMRRMARRMLVEASRDVDLEDLRSDKNSAKTLMLEQINQSASDPVRLEAVWALHSSRMLSKEGWALLVKDKSASLRAWAARLAGEYDLYSLHELEENSNPRAVHRYRYGYPGLVKLAGDTDAMVRASVGIALRGIRGRLLTVPRYRELEQTPPALVTPVFVELISTCADANDILQAFHLWMALEPRIDMHPEETLQMLATSAAQSQPLSRVLSHKAMRRLCDTRKPENLNLAIAFCDKITAHDVLLVHALGGLVKGQESGVIKPTQDISASLAKWRAHSNTDVRKHAQTLAVLWGDEAALQETITALRDTTKPEKDRVALLQSIAKVKSDTVKKALLLILSENTSPALSVAAIRAAADFGTDDFIAPLLAVAQASGLQPAPPVVQASGLPSAPQTRGLIYNAVIEALCSRTTWTHALLDAIGAGKVSATGFPAPVRRALATSQDTATRNHAAKVLGAWQDSSDDVKVLIAKKKQACLTGEPDLANGKLLFTATCMVCHEFHGGGQKVGPDLIGSGRSNLDAILANVIDPNQIIGNGYENFTVSTKDGRTLAGRVVEDTPAHVKLLGAGGASQIVPRDQVATLTNTKQSLMPMGFGNLPDTAFRDLVWYVLAPPEEGPLTKEKKDLLIKGVEETVPSKPKNSSRAIDWESVNLWNPAWTVSAPDFERTPMKLSEYYGKKNVLLIHPFPDKKTPASFERTFKVEPGKTKLTATVAADDRGDWTAKALINGQAVKELTVDHEKPRWKTIELDLSKFTGQEITLRLESHANGWNMEFAYWGGIEVK
ncbi:PVC-type heme-binding CxxCH protein [Prosthecobacter sp.]|uniref:PVC-type heme-binding CxxCH protein n=1 Tax=Prosthecobacter sp. TaxID=1965333 RepID=UPI003783AA12